MTVLSCLTDSCDPKSHKKHLLEVFEWIHDILSVQLSSEVSSRFMITRHDGRRGRYDY
jgi:hypothetical protein